MKMHGVFLLFLLLPFIMASQNSTADCNGGIYLCNKNMVTVSELPGPGFTDHEANNIPCAPDGIAESNSVWFKFNIEKSGILSFSIIPIDESDDLDFVLFKFKSTVPNCAQMDVVRCMNAGPVLGENAGPDMACTGATGLLESAPGEIQNAGCPEDINNFLSAVQVNSGERYALFINNFRSAQGFALDFSGDCIFDPTAGNCAFTSGETTTTLPSPDIEISDAYPNPASDAVSIEIRAEHACNAEVQIIRQNGILVFSQSYAVLSGANLITIPTLTMPGGAYFIKVKAESTTRISRFIRQ